MCYLIFYIDIFWNAEFQSTANVNTATTANITTAKIANIKAIQDSFLFAFTVWIIANTKDKIVGTPKLTTPNGERPISANAPPIRIKPITVPPSFAVSNNTANTITNAKAIIIIEEITIDATPKPFGFLVDVTVGINGSFETGDLSGWSTDIEPEVIQQAARTGGYGVKFTASADGTALS